MNPFDFSLPQESQAVGRFEERAGIDLVIGLRNRRKGGFGAIHDREGETMSKFPVAGIVGFQAFDGVPDAAAVFLVTLGIRRVEELLKTEGTWRPGWL